MPCGTEHVVRGREIAIRAVGAALVTAGVLLAGLLARSSPWYAAGLVVVIGGLALLALRRDAAALELGQLAMTDTLTALLNRRAFMDLAERERARAQRTRHPIGVLMLDLDRFKQVNDNFGHAAGDRVLTDFAAVARAQLRPGDLVGRFGGEEFCVVLPDADLARAGAIAERIRAAAAERPLGALQRRTTVSIGATSCIPGPECTLEATLAQADRALYDAKQQGRNRVCVLPMLRLAHSRGAAQNRLQRPERGVVETETA